DPGAQARGSSLRRVCGRLRHRGGMALAICPRRSRAGAEHVARHRGSLRALADVHPGQGGPARAGVGERGHAGPAALVTPDGHPEAAKRMTLNAYDEVPYTSYPYPRTHPDRLCTL